MVHEHAPGAAPACAACADTRHVCENHHDRPWGPLCCTAGETGPCQHGACGCGAGEPCPTCCTPPPADGTARIGDAFTPTRTADRTVTWLAAALRIPAELLAGNGDCRHHWSTWLAAVNHA